jgi:hypothetical protein
MLTPRSQQSLPEGENRQSLCEECSEPIEIGVGERYTTRRRFCTDGCRYRARDRLRDPEKERERSRRYYSTHREEVLARARAKRERESAGQSLF